MPAHVSNNISVFGLFFVKQAENAFIVSQTELFELGYFRQAIGCGTYPMAWLPVKSVGDDTCEPMQTLTTVSRSGQIRAKCPKKAWGRKG